MHFCSVEVSWIYWHRNWDSKGQFKSSYAPRFHPVDDLENIGLKKLSLSQVYAPRFHLVDKWISTVEFKSS